MEAIPPGERKRDDAPVPSADPGVPAVPAGVVTTPERVTLRTVWFPVSVTYMSLPSAAIPCGPLNRGGMSVEPEVPASPATVETTPADVIFRTVWFPVSVTYRSLPRAAIPRGLWNRGGLSVEPEVPASPAKVETTPDGV